MTKTWVYIYQVSINILICNLILSYKIVFKKMISQKQILKILVALNGIDG